ncbi:hypothetical protein [Hymenobacter profundi]|uniref:Hemerythrin-like domain-containing protein n=1 Tax=Hymenobacter profundi TaxID=1982110 RepID=A0ABS6WVR8_9BACT|nr:hypothetical protein [Hymenobacter profundi]MBW3127707.1 hypothetical protein [Hymenobacter profundi]
MSEQSRTTSPTEKKRKRCASSARRQVYLAYEAHAMLLPAAERAEITASEYASAAVSFFAERGLNPVTDREREGLVIQAKIHDLEKVVATLSNRLFGWLTQHEMNLNRDLFGYLRGHEKTLFSYLQQQEQNVHEHLSDQEEMFLMPLIQEAMLTNVEALYGRRLGEQLMLTALNRADEFPAKHREFNSRRDEDVKKKVDQFVTNLVPPLRPEPSLPPLTAIPNRAEKSTPAPANSVSDGLPEYF